MAKNKLIELLPPAERARLLAIAEPFDLVLSEVLCQPGTPTRHASFPTGGFKSLGIAVPGPPGVEVGRVGSEGLVGAYPALDVTVEPLHTVVQGAGSVLRVATKPFMQELGRSPVLRGAVNRFLYVLMAQLATASACLRFHEIEARLARWLPMSQDRAHADTFHVTRDFLACMLGVRRVGITGIACPFAGPVPFNAPRSLLTSMCVNFLRSRHFSSGAFVLVERRLLPDRNMHSSWAWWSPRIALGAATGASGFLFQRASGHIGNRISGVWARTDHAMQGLRAKAVDRVRQRTDRIAARRDS